MTTRERHHLDQAPGPEVGPDRTQAGFPNDRAYAEALARDATHEAVLSGGLLMQSQEELLPADSDRERALDDLSHLAGLEYLDQCRNLTELRDAEDALLAVNIELAQLIVSKRGLAGSVGAAAVARAQATLARITAADRALFKHAVSRAEFEQARLEIETGRTGDGPRYNFAALHKAQALATESSACLAEANRNVAEATELLEKCTDEIGAIMALRATS